MKIHWHWCKEHLQISKMAKFESHIIQDGEDMVLKVQEILQMFVW